VNIPQDFKDLLAAFASEQLRFLLIGGYAVSYHGQPRATKDIDFFVSVDPENRMRLARARAKFGVAGPVNAARLMIESEIVYFGIKPLRVDILGSASGLDFEGTYARADLIHIDQIPIRVIGIDDLIVNKRASGREQDLKDCAMLERVKERRGK
jgi:predicted nucleotidyltransferase